MRRAILGATLAAAALAATTACAEVLYKLIDRSGKVTYSETQPKDFDGQVIRLEISPAANTAAASPPAPQPAAAPRKAMPAEPAGLDRRRIALERARLNLESARKALEDARDHPDHEGDLLTQQAGPGPGRGGMHGMSGGKGGFLGGSGGTRQVPNEEYLARLAALEDAVKRAEAEIRRIEEGK